MGPTNGGLLLGFPCGPTCQRANMPFGCPRKTPPAIGVSFSDGFFSGGGFRGLETKRKPTHGSRATFHFHSFQGSESVQETIKNAGKLRFLKRTIFENNGHGINP